MGREGTWDRAGTPADIPPTANEVGMASKNRDHGFLQRFLPVSTWTQDGFFLKKTLSFLYNGGFVLGLGRKVSPAVTAEGVTSEAEATWCDSPQPLNFKIPFNLRTLLWISLSFKSSLLLPGLIFGLAVSKNKDW